MKSLSPEGKDIAVTYLKGKVFRILQCNYKNPLGEANVIACDKDTTVFAEVKTRSSARLGEHFGAVVARTKPPRYSILFEAWPKA